MAPISAAAVRNRPPITGVSSTTGGRGRRGFAEAVDFLAGDSALPAGFSLSLMTSGVIAQKLREHYCGLPGGAERAAADEIYGRVASAVGPMSGCRRLARVGASNS